MTNEEKEYYDRMIEIQSEKIDCLLELIKLNNERIDSLTRATTLLKDLVKDHLSE